MIIPITPQPKPRMTRADSWKRRPAVLRYWRYKDELKKYDIQLGKVLSVTFVLPIPKSWSNKKREDYLGQAHQNRPDLDNLVKALQDSLLDEDSHIYGYEGVYKIWGLEGAILIDEPRPEAISDRHP